MEKELVELFEAAKKAADAASASATASGGPEESRCLDALKQLKDFPVTYQVLVSSQVGKRLRHLTKHPRKKIQALASELIEMWKNIIIEETARSKKGQNSYTGNSIKVEPANSTTSSISKKVENVTSLKIEKTAALKVERTERSGAERSERIVKSEPVKVQKVVERKTNEQYNHVAPPKLMSMLKSGDAVRDKVRELLSEALAKVHNEVYDEMKEEVSTYDPIRVAVSVESVMFENWGRSTGSQKSKYRSIMFNFKDPNNPDFRRKVLTGQVKPAELLNMNVEEMASDQRQFENAKIKEKALFECERGQPSVASTNEFRCGRCGKRECSYYQMQIRSADEPMTTFVTCCNCNNRWKFC